MSQSDYEAMFEHEHDGIREYDNPLPAWWTWLFILSVVFSVVYVGWYHLGVGPSIHDGYESEVATYYEHQLARLGLQQADDATIIRLMNDESMMGALSGMFQSNCAQCHRADGGGSIGPNLTDDSFKNVKTPADLYTVITNGVAGTAMTSWENRLREPQRILLAAYVGSLRGSNPPNAKAPEGSRIPPWPAAEASTPEPGEVADDPGGKASAAGVP
jgi:cytochrome c oxidase cbb3-type subunit 3